MPGLWVHLKDNPDFFKDFSFGKGEYFECTLYDSSHQEQGKGVWRIISPETKKKDGIWAMAKLVAVTDDHLVWWLTEGGGRDASRKFWLHFCAGDVPNCGKTKRKPEEEFHTDYFRALDTSDLVNLRVAWFKSEPAKEDIADEVAKLTGGAPRGGRKKGPKPGQSNRGDLDWSMSDHESPPDLPAGEDDGLRRRLAVLKRQTAGEPAGHRGDPGGKHKDRKRDKSPSKHKRRSRDRRRGGSPEKAKDQPLWFGKRVSPSPCGEASSESTRARSTRKDKKKQVRSRSPSSEKKKKKKRAKKDHQADRGPYGVGQRRRYDGKSSGDLSTEDETGQPDDQVFRAGPSSTSKHLQLQEYAEKRPGRLTARLLNKMRDILAREEGPMHQGAGTNLTPSAASSYFLTVIVPQYKERLTLRTSRELRTTAKALDLLAQGRADRAGDVLSQRYKALELYLADQTWSRAQFLELIPPEGATLVEKDEMLMASKEQTVEQRMRATLGTPQWRAPSKGDVKGDEKGKSKGKGKGKKGRGPGNNWTHQQESEKPPAA